MRVEKPLPTEKKYGSAVAPDLNKRGEIACKLCYPFCKKGRNKTLHFNMLLCVLGKILEVYVRN